ncbi:TFIIA-alpha and beta-like factor [Chanos chanos]|uniref:TFIIA-alpha and beta-like factor n=1 Tax=Chanos chanos TaxID=29144 RepID=A0A6J2V5V6_CHACN|nr:TFIIA-alpha and beta-like factor [Chanos chanos]
MLSNSGALPKLYLSIIDDVIESIRELFLDEGVEERVLDELRQMWETKVMQSKAVEGLMKDTINPSNFVLQLPASYSQTLHKPTGSIVIPSGQNVQNFTTKASCAGTLATFSLPPGVNYPVQIPAGVTLQTASGHFYKVNVPVMVTQAPGGHRHLSQPIQPLMEQRKPPVPQQAVPPPVLQTVSAPVSDLCPPPMLSSRPVSQASELPVSNQPQNQLPQQAQAIMDQSSQSALTALSQPSVNPELIGPPPDSPSEFTLEGIEFSPQALNMSLSSVFTPQMVSLRANQSDQTPLLDTEFRNIETEGAVREEEQKVMPSMGHSMTLANMENAPDGSVKLDMELLRDYNFNELADIAQLDGACDSSSDGEGEGVEDLGVVGENEFLGMINAEALRALAEGEGSSDDAGSSVSAGDEPDDNVEEEEEDPLNSGDDVSEQDIPEIFDTDNVIVCQYDKIHRSKNRWKFYLKDGVMCYGGKDYVFSKAVGEAEW